VPIHFDVQVYSGRRLTCVNTQIAQITVAANSLAVTNRLRLHEYRASWYLDHSTAQNANPFCKALYKYVDGQNTNKTKTSLKIITFSCVPRPDLIAVPFSVMLMLCSRQCSMLQIAVHLYCYSKLKYKSIKNPSDKSM